ncbi:MAG TPA: class I SAM-dependent methyltransferase [Bryobacteraceae bacterium]|jgi:acetylserotonin N-methyltransferase
MNLPDPTPVSNLIEAFRWSKTMFTAASLGIFDKLPATAGSLAQSLGLNADALERLLDGNVGLGLLERRGEAYYNQPVADTYLRKDSPHSLIGYVLYSDRALYPMWAHLDDAMREGTARWQQTFGVPGAIFDHFFRTEDDMRTFVMGMHGFGVLSSPEVVRAFDLGRFRKLVDLGGATGHLTIAACEAYPQLHGTVFDLAKVIPVAQDMVSKSLVAAQITCVAGDFFEGELPEADLYALGRILHDWSEPKIEHLLRRLYERLPKGGALLIAERLLNEEKSGPLNALMQSLGMLVCTEGKERTLDEYRALAMDAGFGQVEGRKTGRAVDAILCEKL